MIKFRAGTFSGINNGRKTHSLALGLRFCHHYISELVAAEQMSSSGSHMKFFLHTGRISSK